MSWPLVKLGDICTFVNGDRGKNYPSSSEFVEEGIPFINAGDLIDNQIDKKRLSYISSDKFDLLSSGKVCKDDLLFCLRGSLGKFAIVDDITEGAIASSLVIIRAGNKITTKYLFEYLRSSLCENEITKFANGAAQPNLSGKDLKDFQIPLPSLEEQKRVAAILDKADSLRRKNQQAIQLADQFLRAVFFDMFGDPVTNPKGWDIVKVGSIVDCIVPGRDKPKSFTGNMPWVTTNDLCHLGLTYEPKKFLGLTDFEIKEVKAKIVPKGSVLMTCVGDLGVVSVSGKDIVINQQLHAFLPSPKVNNMFLMYALAFQKNFMLNMASNTTVPYMNKTICNSVPLIIPPINDQNRFGEIYEKAQAKLIKMEQSETKCFELFNSLSQKAFAGEL